MNKTALCVTATMLIVTQAQAEEFTLTSSTLQGQLTQEQVYNGFGCQGRNRSPDLHWTEPPAGTKSFAVTVYDPDAPTGSGWWHWVLANIPAESRAIPEDAGPQGKLPAGSVESMTDFGQPGFGGACPPEGDGAHAYVFTIYALDVASLPIQAETGPAMVGFMINQHSLAQTSMISYFAR